MGSAAKVDEVDLGEWLTEELGAQAGELLYGVGGVEGAGGGPGFGDGLRGGGLGRPEVCGYGVCGGLGRVDDGEGVVEVGEGLLKDAGEEGVVGAAEKEGGEGRVLGEGFGEVDAGDIAGDGVVDPALFDQGDEEGAGLFDGVEAKVLEGVEVGVGLDGGGGGEDEDGGPGGGGSACGRAGGGGQGGAVLGSVRPVLRAR